MGMNEIPAAIDAYTRAIFLDPRKTVYYTNRAVAFNAIRKYSLAELDCRWILLKDGACRWGSILKVGKNGKALYQRALARVGQNRWREAESDLREVLKYQPSNETVKKLMIRVKQEVSKLPKQKISDVLDF